MEGHQNNSLAIRELGVAAHGFKQACLNPDQALGLGVGSDHLPFAWHFGRYLEGIAP